MLQFTVAKISKRQDDVLESVTHIESTLYQDQRGHFLETWSQSLSETLVVPTLSQVNLSHSRKGVIRGLHRQKPPYSQGKLVVCLSGAIQDVVVDIDPKSSSFGKYTSNVLLGNTEKMLWVPKGLAHGFQALSEDTIVLYMTDSRYMPGFEETIYPLDKTIGISWKLDDFILSAKDLEGISLSSLRQDSEVNLKPRNETS